MTTTSHAGFPPLETLDDASVEGQIKTALFEVLDPDLGVNLVDMGFVLGIECHEREATIHMTLTSAACPLTQIMEDQIHNAIVEQRGLVDAFTIDWIWTPSWTPEQITLEGREQLTAIGFNF